MGMAIIVIKISQASQTNVANLLSPSSPTQGFVIKDKVILGVSFLFYSVLWWEFFNMRDFVTT
jgi:hypothetical protein